jgi:hypothetical protein
MSEQQTRILVRTVANLQRAVKVARTPVADQVRDAQADVADKRKRAQVNEEVLRLRLR